MRRHTRIMLFMLLVMLLALTGVRRYIPAMQIRRHHPIQRN